MTIVRAVIALFILLQCYCVSIGQSYITEFTDAGPMPLLWYGESESTKNGYIFGVLATEGSFIAKYDTLNQQKWLYEFNATVTSIKNTTHDQTLIIATKFTSPGVPGSGVILLDSLGSPISKFLIDSVYLNDITPINDSIAYAVGYIPDYVGGLYHRSALYRINLNGTVEWKKTMDWNQRLHFNSIEYDGNDAMYIAGEIVEPGLSGGRRGLLIKMSQNGILDWAKQIGSRGQVTLNEVDLQDTSAIMVVGTAHGLSLSHSFNQTQTLIGKFSSAGDSIWIKEFETNYQHADNEAFSGCFLDSGNYMVAAGGNYLSADSSLNDHHINLIVLDTNGTIIRQNAKIEPWLGVINRSNPYISFHPNSGLNLVEIGLSGNEMARNWHWNEISDFLFCDGEKGIYAPGTDSLYTIDFIPSFSTTSPPVYGFGLIEYLGYSLGVYECLTTEIKENNTLNVSLHPNPANSLVTLKTNTNESFYSIYDVNGKMVRSEFVSIPSSQIDISDFESGLYVVLVQSGSQQVSCKLIKW